MEGHDDHVAYRYHKWSRGMPKAMGRNWWKIDEQLMSAAVEL